MPGIGLLREAPKILHPAQDVVIGFQVVRAFAHDPSLLLQGELEFQRRHDLLYDLVLQGKDVCERTVVALRPQVPAGGGVDQLHGDSHLLVCLAYAAFQHIAHAHLAAHVLYLHRFAFVREGGVAGNDK